MTCVYANFDGELRRAVRRNRLFGHVKNGFRISGIGNHQRLNVFVIALNLFFEIFKNTCRAEIRNGVVCAILAVDDTYLIAFLFRKNFDGSVGIVYVDRSLRKNGLRVDIRNGYVVTVFFFLIVVFGVIFEVFAEKRKFYDVGRSRFVIDFVAVEHVEREVFEYSVTGGKGSRVVGIVGRTETELNREVHVFFVFGANIDSVSDVTVVVFSVFFGGGEVREFAARTFFAVIHNDYGRAALGRRGGFYFSKERKSVVSNRVFVFRIVGAFYRKSVGSDGVDRVGVGRTEYRFAVFTRFGEYHVNGVRYFFVFAVEFKSGVTVTYLEIVRSVRVARFHNFVGYAVRLIRTYFVVVAGSVYGLGYVSIRKVDVDRSFGDAFRNGVFLIRHVRSGSGSIIESGVRRGGCFGFFDYDERSVVEVSETFGVTGHILFVTFAQAECERNRSGRSYGRIYGNDISDPCALRIDVFDIDGVDRRTYRAGKSDIRARRFVGVGGGDIFRFNVNREHAYRTRGYRNRFGRRHILRRTGGFILVLNNEYFFTVLLDVFVEILRTFGYRRRAGVLFVFGFVFIFEFSVFGSIDYAVSAFRRRSLVRRIAAEVS